LIAGGVIVIGFIGGVSMAADADSPEASPALEKSVRLGPLKFAGGIADGKVASSLTGGYVEKLLPIASLSKCYDDQFKVGAYCSLSQIDLNATVDAAWKTGADAPNHAVASLQPTFEYEFHHSGPASSPQYDPNHPECADPEKYLESSFCMEGLNDAGSHGVFAIGVYPDVQYRRGSVMQGGVAYDANQLIYGGGSRFLFPALRSSIWATWPYLSIGYDAVHDYGSNSAPAPDGVKDHYLVMEGQVEIYIPGTARLFRAPSNSIILAKLNESHAPGGKWEDAQTFQLIVDIGGKLKPAVTYQAGTDKGFKYDKQILVGLVYALFDHQAGVSK
jgi:hypothetical protein